MKHVLIIGIWAFLAISCQSSGSKTPAGQEKNVPQKSLVVMPLAIHYQDSFSAEEKAQLTQWITQVANATAATLGTYPFTTDIYFKRSSSSKDAGPVPWAFTKRNPTQQAHFHVNMDFTLQEFLSDWTAPHELSHLSIPFVGKSNSWFAEGYASFMQYQVMHTLGVLTADEVNAKYQEKFAMHMPYFKGYENEIPQRAMELRKEYNYPAMYWGGAYYFYQIDSTWMEQGVSLTQVISAYQTCRPKATYQPCDQVEAHLRQLADSLAQ